MRTLLCSTAVELMASTGTAWADTAQEIKDVVKGNIAYSNQKLSQDPMRISKSG